MNDTSIIIEAAGNPHKVISVGLYNMLPAKHRHSLGGINYAVINGKWHQVTFEHILQRRISQNKSQPVHV